jgi:hypothetical protein
VFLHSPFCFKNSLKIITNKLGGNKKYRYICITKANNMTTQEIKINIERLEKTINNRTHAKGYIENCKVTLEWYKSLLRK